MALLGVLAWEYGHKNNALIHGNIKIEENKHKTESSFHVYQPGFEPGSLGLRVGRSTNWAIQPLNFGDFKSFVLLYSNTADIKTALISLLIGVARRGFHLIVQLSV